MPGTRRIRDTGTGTVGDWSVLDRSAFGDGVTGPAVIAEDETSTLVGPGWTARVLPGGTIELRRMDA